MKTNSILNSSVSKEQHAFSKSARFAGIKSYTQGIMPNSYNKMSDFDHTIKKGAGKGRHDFGSRLDRFVYTPFSSRTGKVGPANYEITDVFSPKTTFDRSNRYSFGVSRMSMKRSFIEDFEHRSKLGPAPDSYDHGPKFG